MGEEGSSLCYWRGVGYLDASLVPRAFLRRGEEKSPGNEVGSMPGCYKRKVSRF